jgi:multidrug resistance efflux pump
MPDSNSKSTVSTPLRFRWQRTCTQYLPFVFFALLCTGCLLLWQFQNRSIVQIGEVEALSSDVTSPAAGIVTGWATHNGESMPVFSSVTKNQIIIELDDSDLVQDIQRIKRQLNNIDTSTQSKIASLLGEGPEKTLVAASGPNAAGADDDKATSPWEKLAALTQSATREISITQLQLDLRKTDSQIRALQTAELSPEEKSQQRSSLNRQRRDQIAQIEAIRIELFSGDAISASDLATESSASFNEAERMLFQSSIQRSEMLEQQIETLQKSATRLDIRAPITGQIEKSLVGQYDLVQPGTTVASIAPTEGTVIVVYARETGPVRPFAGMPVVLTARSNPLLRAETIVSSVGPKIQSVPPRQRANPRIEEWGRPMRIDIPDSFVIEPGALVNVAFDLNRPQR